MSATRIAVVGIACRYPDADNPSELWQNVLSGRRAFRPLPPERISLADYYSPDPEAPDRFYSAKAAVIEGFEFDRVKYRIAGSTYRATDLTHWLALDTAAQALTDAGFDNGAGLPRTSTGVIIGNTLTGEFSRAGIMRLRWPYVRRSVGEALREQGWQDEALTTFLAELEVRYKAPFPVPDEDMLAGGLSNTIAGRICNYFDLNGGGFTMDGACSSSLISVSTACAALSDGQLDVAIAGGVDLSIDPFELIGFAKTGALASGEMRVYDKDSNGFWPGEGCGMTVLMREQDAIEQGRRVYATIAGWGWSSDGKGGITRPEASGHQLAIKRAYAVAGFGIETVGYLEGHGTGTAVGDATELRALSAARRGGDPNRAPAAISTVKGNMGHTKAAAGIGGLLKAILAVHHQVIPPATSHVSAHPELLGSAPALRVPSTAETWPIGEPIRAGVSSMGFGGINTHIVLEQSSSEPGSGVDSETHRLVRSRQDCELLLIDAHSTTQLAEQVSSLIELGAILSFAELGDLAASLQRELSGGPIRAAVLARSPEEAVQRLQALKVLLAGGARTVLDRVGGIFLGDDTRPPRIGLLFPGQGAGRNADGGALGRRFATVQQLYRENAPAGGTDLVSTAIAQPRIATSSVAGLRMLAMLGITGELAIGHSLGELAALHWAGGYDEASLLAIAAARGQIMADTGAADGSGPGTMANIQASPQQVAGLLVGETVVIAGYNSPRQTVISGPTAAVERVCARAQAEGLHAMRIAVSHAFHSDLVAPAASRLHSALSTRQFLPLQGRVVSTVTGDTLPPDTDLPDLLARQVRAPVRFTDALDRVSDQLDLLLEVGPGRILTSLANEISPAIPAFSLETDSNSLTGFFTATAAAFVLGAPVRHELLFTDRFTRPLPLDKQFRFFANPCESVSVDTVAAAVVPVAVPEAAGSRPQPRVNTAAEAPAADLEQVPSNSSESATEILRRLAAERAELPIEAVSVDSLLLDELHLSSITVAQIVNLASRELGLAAPVGTSVFATSTLSELAEMLEAQDEQGDSPDDGIVAGVGPWVRAFAIEQIETEVGPSVPGSVDGTWQLFAADQDPMATELTAGLERAGVGDGVLLWLPADCAEDQVPVMLEAAQAALGQGGPVRFVAVGGRRGAAALAKTLCLEAPAIPTTVISLSSQGEAGHHPVPVAALVADIAATERFSEVCYDKQLRRVPVLRPLQLAPSVTGGSALTAADVLLVTGGGKGITAECALSLALASGAAIGLLGRADPATDSELSLNLERMAAAGVRHHYVRTDVTAEHQVKSAMDEVRAMFGEITAILHGAGRNAPQALAALDADTFRATVAPKVGGLEAVLAASDPGSLRLLITFGSIIGRAGLRGEADYATANDWLTDLTRRVGEENPGCRCIALEWSVWSGAGMGERLGVLEALVRDGISPISTQQGLEILHRIIDDPSTPVAVVVMGRADGLPTVTLEKSEPPLLRFIDEPRVHYPGVELVADATLTSNGDLYLADHLLDGDLLFPAVFGMEAMAQVSGALIGSSSIPVLSNVEFLRPIVVPVSGETTIRIAALHDGADQVEVVIRSSETAFQADHFRATLRYNQPWPTAKQPERFSTELLPLDPHRDLYSGVLFQGPRFQRLLGYQALSATHCIAEIANVATEHWFAGYLSGDLILGDPGTRDAIMHTIQCCVPDATLLPVGIEQLYLADPSHTRELPRLTSHATERSRDGDDYLYDVDVFDDDGTLVERWTGLHLRAVRKLDGAGPWVPALLGPYLQRRAELVLGAQLHSAVTPLPAGHPEGITSRREQTARTLALALGEPRTVRYRPDGRPEVDGGLAVSASHGAGVTLVVAGQASGVSCDIETATARTPEDWANLLGPNLFATAQLLAAERREDLSIAATRVWTVLECLRKDGQLHVESIFAGANRSDNWVVLHSGTAVVATFVTALRGNRTPVAVALSIRN